MIKIVTDSTLDLSKEVIERYGIEVVPLTFTIDGASYVDGKDITPEGFIDKMEASEELPKSSQPPIGQFVELYDRLGDEGHSVISIHMTGGMSGTAQSAAMAASMSRADVTVVDSKFISMGLSFQVLEAVIMCQLGKSVDEILNRLEEVRKNTRLYVAVSTFDNLVKGGRIGKAKALVGTLLHIKPIATLFEGQLKAAVNARSNAQIVKFLTKQFIEDIKGKTIKGIGIAHARAEQLAVSLKTALYEQTGFANIQIEHTSPIISTHTGAGAIGFSYYFEEN